MKTKDIVVNGVNIRLYKLDTEKQGEINEVIFPALQPLLKGYALAQFNKKVTFEKIDTLIDDVFRMLPPKTIHSIMWKYFLEPNYIKLISPQGGEAPFWGSSPNGTRCIMNEDVDDIAWLYLIAKEAFLFNFSNFTKLAESAFQFGNKLLRTK